MKAILIILIFIHGAIHLLGFVKAFGLSKVNQLTLPISKPFGIAWLFASVFFIIMTVMIMLEIEHWWLMGFLAVVHSQILIISSWRDAKYGTIANVIILIAAIIEFMV